MFGLETLPSNYKQLMSRVRLAIDDTVRVEGKDVCVAVGLDVDKRGEPIVKICRASDPPDGAALVLGYCHEIAHILGARTERHAYEATWYCSQAMGIDPDTTKSEYLRWREAITANMDESLRGPPLLEVLTGEYRLGPSDRQVLRELLGGKRMRSCSVGERSDTIRRYLGRKQTPSKKMS